MRAELQPGTRTGSELERRYPVALGLYAGLGLLVWFTVGAGSVLVFHKPVEIRLIALLIIGSFALRTVLAMQAEKIRRRGDEGGGSASRDV
jgi:hypothetical protein